MSINNFNKYIKENNEISQRVINPEMINKSLPNLFKRNIKLGYKPFYISKDYFLKEIKLNKNWMPYKESDPFDETDWRGLVIQKTKKTYYSNKSNPFGNIFFINEDEFDKINSLVNKVRQVRLDKLESLKLLDNLIASTINEL